MRPAHAPAALDRCCPAWRLPRSSPPARFGSGARFGWDAGGGRGSEAARGPSRPPRWSREAAGARPPAAPAQETGGAERTHRGSARSTRRAGAAASSSGSVPNQRSATPRVRDVQRRDRRLRPPLSQAGNGRAELAWGCKEGVGSFLKKGLAPELGPGPPRKPALHPNAPPGSADFE